MANTSELEHTIAKYCILGEFAHQSAKEKRKKQIEEFHRNIRTARRYFTQT